VNGTERQVKIELTGDDYHLAVLAHDNREMVQVFGDVHVKSKSAWMLNPTKFGVIAEDDLF
jgi:quinolinate synthase